MAVKQLDELPFNARFNTVSGYQLTTPYGVISVSQDGRQIVFQLWEDVRQSIHNKALFSYFQQLTKRGISRLNCDHLTIPGLDKSLNLDRGKARLDLCYMNKARLVEIELKTHREIGLDRTRLQLAELVKHCQNLVVVVPRRDMEEMLTILRMLNLDKQITVDSYELLDDEEG